jgi:ribonuclease HI
VTYLLKRRSAKIMFTWVKGHNRMRGNEESDQLVKEGALKERSTPMDLNILTKFDLQGAKLNTID